MNKNSSLLRLYFIAGSQDCRHLPGDPARHLLNILQKALQAGISCFQFRDKGPGSLQQDRRKQYQLAEQCRDLCRRHQVPFIVNDDVEMGLAIEADGLHTGQSDTRIEKIIRHAPPHLILGLSINNQAQALAAEKLERIDYFGVGPIFPTQSKADAQAAVGPEFIAALRRQGIRKPIVAIGGINQENLPQLRHKGAQGIALISAITRAENIQQRVQQLLKIQID
ncbi:thiamine-phosphate diphosphorylase [Mesocricetibacter intestinalis]|uniref:Thiamine-phosphate synthase n=1 Tax=Mesocricetibacter intestinalis TaxID=1521930 RepID=A0A4R6VCU8_9PAST|nr:thiamine phosphate synthase [Mesocricetibacter intestinalis]TDQ59784.1 thiamine-phosphate diphosphorylase [Mesocricetibacter intestinalis]